MQVISPSVSLLVSQSDSQLVSQSILFVNLASQSPLGTSKESLQTIQTRVGISVSRPRLQLCCISDGRRHCVKEIPAGLALSGVRAPDKKPKERKQKAFLCKINFQRLTNFRLKLECHESLALTDVH